VSLTYIGTAWRGAEGTWVHHARRIGVTVSFDNGVHGPHTRENYYRLTELPLSLSLSLSLSLTHPSSCSVPRRTSRCLSILPSPRLAPSHRVASRRDVATPAVRSCAPYLKSSRINPPASSPFNPPPVRTAVPSIMNRSGENFVDLDTATCRGEK